MTLIDCVFKGQNLVENPFELYVVRDLSVIVWVNAHLIIHHQKSRPKKQLLKKTKREWNEMIWICVISKFYSQEICSPIEQRPIYWQWQWSICWTIQLTIVFIHIIFLHFKFRIMKVILVIIQKHKFVEEKKDGEKAQHW